MTSEPLSIKDRSWWMLLLLPAAFWFSGWQGAAGLLLGWAASAVNLYLMRSPFNKTPDTALALQVLVLKSVLLRFITIMAAMALSGLIARLFQKQDALFWAGGAILLGQALMIISAASHNKGRLGGENHGRNEDR